MPRTVIRGARYPGDLAFEDGIITELGVVDQKDSDVELQYDDAIITPGLINTHTLFTPSSLSSPVKENLTLLKGGLE